MSDSIRSQDNDTVMSDSTRSHDDDDVMSDSRRDHNNVLANDNDSAIQIY